MSPCRKVKYRKEYEEFRIYEQNRTKASLKAASVIQDAVFTQICELHDANAVIAADLYCPILCNRNFIRKGEKLCSKAESVSLVQKETKI